MQLSVMERFVIQGLLPQRASMTDLLIAKNIREAVGFTEDELVALEIKEDGGRVEWNPEAAAAIVKDVEFSGPQTALLVAALDKLDKDNELQIEHLSLCEKFGIGA